MMTLVACVQIPNLAVAVARRDDPRLAEQSLVLYCDHQQRAVVAAASDDTGLGAGTPLRQAVVRCPNAVYRPADPERDRQVLNALATLLESFSPRVAVHAWSPDAVIDLDVGWLTIPQTMVLAQRIAQQIHTRLHLTPALGVAGTRFVAQRAAASAGAGVVVIVAPGCEPAFLAPHSISGLPIDAEIIRRLHLRKGDVTLAENLVALARHFNGQRDVLELVEVAELVLGGQALLPRPAEGVTQPALRDPHACHERRDWAYIAQSTLRHPWQRGGGSDTTGACYPAARQRSCRAPAPRVVPGLAPGQ